jgi:hypothetical protein
VGFGVVRCERTGGFHILNEQVQVIVEAFRLAQIQ